MMKLNNYEKLTQCMAILAQRDGNK